MELKNLLKKEIVKAISPLGIKAKEIILFGSRARGDFEKDSDWDILVVLDCEINQNDKKEIWYRIYKRLHQRFPSFSFDVVIKSKRAYEREKEVVNTLANEAYREGVKL